MLILPIICILGIATLGIPFIMYRWLIKRTPSKTLIQYEESVKSQSNVPAPGHEQAQTGKEPD